MSRSSSAATKSAAALSAGALVNDINADTPNEKS